MQVSAETWNPKSKICSYICLEVVGRDQLSFASDRLESVPGHSLSETLEWEDLNLYLKNVKNIKSAKGRKGINRTAKSETSNELLEHHIDFSWASSG